MLLPQGRNRFRGEAQPGENVIRIRAERRWWRFRPRIAAPQPEPGPHDPHRPVDTLDLSESPHQIAFADLRVFENIRHAQHLAGRHAVAVEARRPMRRAVARQSLLDFVAQDVAIDLAGLALGETRIGGQFLRVE